MPLKVPLSSWRIFEAAARRQSFHSAAIEVGITDSAVSHSIKKMEETLGSFCSSGSVVKSPLALKVKP